MLNFRAITLILVLTLLFSCNRYKSFESRYQFRSETGIPDYGNLDYWAAHPWKWDPSDSVPLPFRNEVKDSTVDVFFLHPTSYTRTRNKKLSNAAINDPGVNAKTDYSSILYQASVFNRDCRVFAPRYRQAHISNFFTKDSVHSSASFELAYADVRTSFEYYLQHYNGGRPIIIAAHSQGSKLALQLLREYFDKKTLYNKLVVAYVPGWPVPRQYFSAIPVCTDSMQTGCVSGWRTLRTGFVPWYLRNENIEAQVNNPLNWRNDGEYAPKSLNRGSVLRSFNKRYPHTTDAVIKNGFLYVRKPRFPWSFAYVTRNYHIGDINLFYQNIRDNVTRRIGAFWKQ